MKKSNIISFIIGAVIFGSVSAFAVQYTISDNPYPIQLNGQNVNIEGYNINDNTYFKLRDISNIIGGFTVDFNNDTIQLATNGYIYDNSVSETETYVDDTYGFKLTIPDSWKNKYSINIEDKYDGEGYLRLVRFCEINSYSNMNDGTVVYLYICNKNSLYNDNDALYGDNARIIAEKDNLVVITGGPLGIPVPEEYFEQWGNLVKSQDLLIDSFEWIN